MEPTQILDFQPACAAVARVVAGIREDQLAGPTPCPAYTVADLLDHVDGLSLAFTHAATKEPLPGGPAAPEADGSRLGDDWRDRIAGRLGALAGAWAAPTAYDGLTWAGPVEVPAEVAALVALDEVVVHGWDLARATGQEYDADPAAVAAALGFATSFEPPESATESATESAPGDAPGGAPADGGLFGPPVPVPDDAPLLDRLAGATGRDPGWTAS